MEDDKNKLSGAKLPWPWKDSNGVAIDPDIPIVTEEQRKQWQKMYEASIPKLKERYKGQIIIMGTGGSLEGDDIGKMFYNLEKYNTEKEEL